MSCTEKGFLLFLHLINEKHPFPDFFLLGFNNWILAIAIVM